MPTDIRIRRHMLSLPSGRQVHYRRAGQGPPLILLHEAPYSSASMIDWIKKFADSYSVIALDTPGNGLSEPIGVPFETVTMADYADDLARTLSALGIERALIYGFHTGALCALEFAGRHPDRATLVIANGYIEMDPELSADIVENYLLSFQTDWTGSHLYWWWTRFRDQYLFFPFHRQTDETRTPFGLPDVESLHAAFVEFLRAGDGYRNSYRCAYCYDGKAGLANARADTVIMGEESDILYPFLDKIEETPPAVSILRVKSRAEAYDAVAQLLEGAGFSQQAPVPVPALPIADRLYRDFVQLSHGSMLVLRDAPGGGIPVLFLHDLGASADAVAHWMEAWRHRRNVLAFDLPGHGESFMPEDFSLVASATSVCEALDALNIAQVDIVGFGAGASLGVEIALQSPSRVRSLVAPEGFMTVTGEAGEALRLKEYIQVLDPDHYGHYITQAWSMFRDRVLFKPWYIRQPTHALPGVYGIQPDILHAQTVAYLKALPGLKALGQACLDYRLHERAAGLEVPVFQAAGLVRCETLKGHVERLRTVELPGEASALCDAIETLLDTL